MNKLDISSFPIDVAQVIGKYDSGTSVTAGDRYFKWVAFGLTCCWTKDAKPGFSVVTFGANNKSWPTPRLFVTRRWTQRNPDKITAVWNVVLRLPFQSTISRPTSTPKSVSPCNWEGVQSLSSALRLSFGDLSGRTMSSPSRTHNSTVVPSATSICPANDCGIRTARLLPHFCTVAIAHLHLRL